ncbi:hypothetical protein ACG33_14995 [Steroidobacter denitrificans]|uniref:DUF3014 domain-containing protein n=1 Tax=Steroidobacter denitrificans TaxID=465721 RepID=A0A127FEI6_STEDE|nr:hypothetical protein ACG33_14995 [Steroidobacter denitrificans]
MYWTLPIVVVIGLLVALYYGRKERAIPEPVVQETPLARNDEPLIQHPISEESGQTQSMPSLANSDHDVQASLDGLFGSSIDAFLIPQNLIRRFVVTVDNLPRKKVALQLRPLKPVPGELVTSNDLQGRELTLSAENYVRYTPVVDLLRKADAAQLTALYRRYYPLFQEAYGDLGYPDAYFNDRLVEVIDHLLATPEIDGPIHLTRPSVYYQFADPALEERSEGQKLLLRMGSSNAAVIKDMLRELREEVTTPVNPPAP